MYESDRLRFFCFYRIPANTRLIYSYLYAVAQHFFFDNSTRSYSSRIVFSCKRVVLDRRGFLHAPTAVPTRFFLKYRTKILADRRGKTI